MLFYVLGFMVALGVWFLGAPLTVPGDWQSLFFLGLALVCFYLAWRARGGERWAMAAVAVLCLMRGIFFPLSTVVSVSMQPNFYEGDYVLFRRPATPVRGDVVLVDGGGGKLLIKRVAAVGGDRIAISDGVVYLNGEPVTEPYPVYRDPEDEMSEITVPEGKLFLLGDNRLQSMDSRRLGVFDLSQVRGEMLWHLPRSRK